MTDTQQSVIDVFYDILKKIILQIHITQSLERPAKELIFSRCVCLYEFPVYEFDKKK